MKKIYGYCRISTNKQSIDRQVRNIRKQYPNASVLKEVYTGTKTFGRTKWTQLLKMVKSGDIIVFDSVSRMSRNAEEGFAIYQELFSKGVELHFLKEPMIDTTTFRSAIESKIQLTGDDVDIILEAVNQYLMKLAENQIRIAFEQAEKEVTDLHQRTKEGIETARLNGKQIGLKKGTKLTTKKSIESKIKIEKYSVDFNGFLNDKECMKLIGISNNTFYKYKRELKSESCA